MATEMILVPKKRYEVLVSDDKEHADKLRYYTGLLRDKGVDFTDYGQDKNNDKPSETNHMDVSENSKGNDNGNVALPKKVAKVTFNNTSEGEGLSSIDIVNEISHSYKLYGQRLLAYIMKKGRDILEWNAKGNIILRGDLVSDTNIANLVEFIFKGKGRRPKGIKEFRHFLREIKVPRAILKPPLLNPPGMAKDMKQQWKKF